MNHPHPSVLAIAERLQTLTHAARSSESALRQLLQLVAPKMRGTVGAILSANHPDVDDAFQESMVAFVRALPQLQDDRFVVAFASTIATRTACRIRKKAKLRNLKTTPVAELEHVEELVEESPDRRSFRRRDLVRSLLDELPEVQAETLALRFVLGMSLEEVAQATGAPVNTVRSRVRLAKEALMKEMQRDSRYEDLLGEEA